MEKIEVMAIIGMGILALLLASIILTWRARRVVSSHYDWLEVLSHYEWKEGSQIHREMSELKSAKIPSGLEYLDLPRLEDERLVESQPIRVKIRGYSITIRQYRLTPAGTRRRVNREKDRHRETSDVPQPA